MHQPLFTRLLQSSCAKRAARLLLAAAAFTSCAALAAPQLGVFRGASPNGPPNVDAFGQWLGRPAAVATVFAARATWDDIADYHWNLQPWSQWVRAQSGRNISYHVSMLPTSGGTLAGCSAGQYDAHFSKLANNLAYYGLHWAYLRIGAEMDGSWFPWNATRGSGKEASYAGCFRRIVQVMRQAQPANQWKFVFNPAMSFGASRAYLESVWPGDAYVDVVGLDFYDQSWAANTYPYPSTCDAACRLTRQKNAWTANTPVLYAARDFAIAHGKPMAFPEWGTGTRPDGHGGGDNPYFIQKMHEFLNDPANNVVYHGHWDYPAPDFNCQLSGATKFPQAAALFKQLFGPTSSATNTAPSVSITAPTAGQTVSGTLTYSANASDNAGVSRVQFTVDSTVILSDTTAPYGGTLDTTKLGNGAHLLKATAYDAQGLSSTSQISINVQNAVAANTPPTVSITAPAAGQTVSGTIAYVASATDNAGVSRVDFMLGSTALASYTTLPYGGGLDTTKLANGTHVLKATAYDALGLSATTQVSINVQNATAPSPIAGPTGVTFTAPAINGTIAGSYKDSPACQVTGTGISKVVFFMDNTQLNTESWEPWQCAFDSRQFANGAHTLKAVAYNAAGGATTVTRSVNVQNGVAGPTGVTFTAPAVGGTMSGAYRDSTACQVTGTGISRVVFFMDGTQLNTESWAPWQCAFDTRRFANGTHTLKAVTYNSAGGATTVTRSVNVRN